jgi:hypothetical protein
MVKSEKHFELWESQNSTDYEMVVFHSVKSKRALNKHFCLQNAVGDH